MGLNNVNFNHEDYRVLKNFYVGVVNEKRKDVIETYNKN